MLPRILVLLVILAVSVSALPTIREKRQIGPHFGYFDSDEDESFSEEGDDDAESSYFDLASILRRMEEMVRRQYEKTATRIAQAPDFASFGLRNGEFDLTKPKNATSTVKIVNGHKVTVNESTFESEVNGSKSVYHVQIVDVEPVQPETSSTPAPAVIPEEIAENNSEQTENEGEPENQPEEETPKPAVASPSENEIPEDPMEAESSELDVAKVLPEWRNLVGATWHKKPTGFRSQFPRGYDVEVLPGFPNKPIDLSSDLRVNQLLSEKIDAGALIMPDPDSEFIEIRDGKLVPSIQTT